MYWYIKAAGSRTNFRERASLCERVRYPSDEAHHNLGLRLVRRHL